MKNEAQLLKTFEQEPTVQGFVPSLAVLLNQQLNSDRAIAMNEVGISLISYIVETKQGIDERRKLSQKLFQDLSSVLIAVHSRFNLCHCDIAPSNIVMRRTDQDFSPMIIDWELATMIGAPFHNHSGRLDLMHSDLIAAHVAQGNMPATDPKFDLVSLEYTMTAFIYGKQELEAPWCHFYIEFDDDFHYWRNLMTEDRLKKTYTVADKEK